MAYKLGIRGRGSGFRVQCVECEFHGYEDLAVRIYTLRLFEMIVSCAWTWYLALVWFHYGDTEKSVLCFSMPRTSNVVPFGVLYHNPLPKNP